MGDHLPSMCEVLSLIFSITKNNGEICYEINLIKYKNVPAMYFAFK